METDSTKPVELGFLEKVQSWKLKCEYFPSKVGGYPAWLDLVGIPSCEAVRCDRCGKPCVFLMQMYSPGTDPKSFHRTIFVFICKNSGCYVRNENCGNIKVFRCQLRLKNDFYDDIPPPEVEHLDDEVNFTCNQKKQKSTILCCVCGCRGPQRCGRCRVKHYCSRDHQLLDWKSEHKFSCRPTSQKPSTEVTSVSGSDEKVGCCGVKSTVTRINNIEASSHSSFNLPEYKLINEEEIISDDESYDDNIKDSNQNAKDEEEKRMKEYQNVTGELQKKISLLRMTESDLEKAAAGSCKDDKHFKRFKKLISHNADQVVRYNRGGIPIWVSGENQPGPKDIPKCSFCGAERTFEFQILPQMLIHLNLDVVNENGVDWGTLSVYTCSQDCDCEPYYQEFLWKQDFSIT